MQLLPFLASAVFFAFACYFFFGDIYKYVMKGLEVAVHSITLQLCILKTFIKTHNLLTLETLFKNHGGKAADGKIKEQDLKP